MLVGVAWRPLRYRGHWVDSQVPSTPEADEVRFLRWGRVGKEPGGSRERGAWLCHSNLEVPMKLPNGTPNDLLDVPPWDSEERHGWET